MVLQLKRFRVEASLTQADVAKQLGVSQPTYQRWESGVQTVPDEKLPHLAEILSVPVAVLTGRHSPITLRVYDDTAPHLSYFGEAVFHFTGGGDPLLLRITDSAANKLADDLNLDASPFIVIRSLSNQLVAIRREAIADAYLQGEACDEFGPEHDSYEVPPVMLPDPRDWRIIESLDFDDDAGDFDEEDVKRVKRVLNVPWTDPVDDRLTLGSLSARNVDEETVAKAWEMAIRLATQCTYQLSKGKRRSFPVDGEKALFEAFRIIFSSWCETVDEGDIFFHDPREPRLIYVRGNAIDYVTVPYHKWLDAAVDAGEPQDA